MARLGNHWYRGWHVTEDYPEITSFDDLIEASKLSEQLEVGRHWLLEQREGDSHVDLYGLPYVRIGTKTYFSKTQFVWWLNQYQRKVQDRRGPWTNNPWGSKGSPLRMKEVRPLPESDTNDVE